MHKVQGPTIGTMGLVGLQMHGGQHITCMGLIPGPTHLCLESAPTLKAYKADNVK